jgi:hypothetical protein
VVSSGRSLTEFILSAAEGFEMTEVHFVPIPSGSEESFRTLRLLLDGN